LPMIWMGQEFGAANPKSMTPEPIDWELLKNENNKGLQQFVAKLVKLRGNNPAIRGDQFQVLMKDKDRCLFVFKRWNEAGGVAIVATNLKDEQSGEFSLPDNAMENGKWEDYTAGNEMSIENGTLKADLGPSEVKIYLKK